MLQYRDRTALNRGDLSRGVSTLTISNISLSDNGSYEVYLPQRGVRCSTHLTVEEGRSQRKDSGAPAPPAEGGPAADVWKAALGVLIPAAFVAAVAVGILVKRGVIQRWMETLRGGMDTLRGGMDTLRGGMETLRGGMETLRGGMDTLRGGMETLRGGKDRETETVGNECENTNLNTDAETGDLQRDGSETSV
ncbi:hypothetical protein CgunFtcFv8_021581 [Champsocephalus gunnari]|uniref:Uncharacterized protein n=1 Tax=Champsocephalus gunnari TaxID=52237 RepID=A0AAN8DPN3_CHAGU|nr:hypothetical protein CgunFtcFv8_021581 [Champsocephalus gunnari]